MPTEAMPILTPDRRGYVLDDQVVAGFAVRQDLSPAQQQQIAEWAERFEGAAPRHVTPTPPGTQELDEATLRVALEHDRQREALQQLQLEGLLDELDDDQRRLIRYPETHPDLHGTSYPLSAGELATLIDATADQIRRWSDQSLLSCELVGTHRRFGRGAVAQAMVLAQASKPEKAGLATLMAGRGHRTLLLLGAALRGLPTSTASLDQEQRRRLALSLRVAAEQVAAGLEEHEQAQAPAEDASRGLRLLADLQALGADAVGGARDIAGVVAAPLEQVREATVNYLHTVRESTSRAAGDDRQHPHEIEHAGVAETETAPAERASRSATVGKRTGQVRSAKTTGIKDRSTASKRPAAKSRPSPTSTSSKGVRAPTKGVQAATKVGRTGGRPKAAASAKRPGRGGRSPGAAVTAGRSTSLTQGHAIGVVKAPGGWATTKPNGTQISLHATQREAITRAETELKQIGGGEVVIRGRRRTRRRAVTKAGAVAKPGGSVDG